MYDSLLLTSICHHAKKNNIPTKYLLKKSSFVIVLLSVEELCKFTIKLLNETLVGFYVFFLKKLAWFNVNYKDFT